MRMRIRREDEDEGMPRLTNSIIDRIYSLKSQSATFKFILLLGSLAKH